MLDSSRLLPRWNIFARELESILAEHGLRLSQLDDRGIVEHREKVRRLQQSLKSPGHLATLNPVEIERLTARLNLSDLEQQRLRASLLATAVEMTLLDRVEARIALMAADDVFNILFEAMRARPEMMVASSSVKAGAFTSENETIGDEQFMLALDWLDEAYVALFSGRYAFSLRARRARAYEAAGAFAQALQALRNCQSPLPESEEWRYWYDEAEAGQRMAEALQQLEGGEA
ncbi:MAG TPA: hypothetical protein VFV38_26150 [Ktedonobacteraceae bacterium]|nr:hypothetical protein [Ktedonobacteraceae bacterium]